VLHVPVGSRHLSRTPAANSSLTSPAEGTKMTDFARKPIAWAK
jgi:hypothetical protein